MRMAASDSLHGRLDDPDKDKEELTMDEHEPIELNEHSYTGINRYHIILFVSLISVSAAGTLLRELHDTPPLLKAWWRLFFTSIWLILGMVYQWYQCDQQIKERVFIKSTLYKLLLASVCTAAHFGLWIWSLSQTSLAQSLLFVSMYPIIVAAYARISGTHLNGLEWIGIGGGILGSALLLQDTSSTSTAAGNDGVASPTFFGDFIAFLASIAFVVYLYAGRSVRPWMPLFLYAAPITFVSAFILLFASLIFEDVTVHGVTARSVFGFLSPSNFQWMILIAMFPGLLGHTGINATLSHLSPLFVSIILTLEPIVGVLIGLLAGVDSTPGVLTLLGGPIAVISYIVAITGTSKREATDPVRFQPLRDMDEERVASERPVSSRSLKSKFLSRFGKSTQYSYRMHDDQFGMYGEQHDHLHFEEDDELAIHSSSEVELEDVSHYPRLQSHYQITDGDDDFALGLEDLVIDDLEAEMDRYDKEVEESSYHSTATPSSRLSSIQASPSNTERSRMPKQNAQDKRMATKPKEEVKQTMNGEDDEDEFVLHSLGKSNLQDSPLESHQTSNVTTTRKQKVNPSISFSPFSSTPKESDKMTLIQDHLIDNDQFFNDELDNALIELQNLDSDDET